MNFTFHNRSVVHLRLPEVNRQQVWLIQMIPDFAVDIGTQFRAPPIVSSINWSVCQTVKKKKEKSYVCCAERLGIQFASYQALFCQNATLWTILFLSISPVTDHCPNQPKVVVFFKVLYCHIRKRFA